MPADIKILSARRAYEFRPDDLRLTMLTMPELVNRVQQEFSFNSAEVRTPIPTFGEVPATMPPGLVFNYGMVQMDKARTVPIRLLHFEPRRVVIDLAGPSAAVGQVYNNLRALFSESRAPDGAAIMGEPTHTRDYSELSLVLPFPSKFLLASRLGEWLESSESRPQDGDLVLVVDLQVSLQPASAEYEGRALLDHRPYYLAVRAGSRPSDRHYFSSGPMDTDTHIAWVARIETLLQERGRG
jgi:hypothetical protein